MSARGEYRCPDCRRWHPAGLVCRKPQDGNAFTKHQEDRIREIFREELTKSFRGELMKAGIDVD